VERRIELVLSHDGRSWRADGLAAPIRGDDLRTLETRIRRRILAGTRPHATGPLRVVFRFDMESIPRWLWQYHPHYFNYAFRVDGAGGL